MPRFVSGDADGRPARRTRARSRATAASGTPSFFGSTFTAVIDVAWQPAIYLRDADARVERAGALVGVAVDVAARVAVGAVERFLPSVAVRPRSVTKHSLAGLPMPVIVGPGASPATAWTASVRTAASTRWRSAMSHSSSPAAFAAVRVKCRALRRPSVRPGRRVRARTARGRPGTPGSPRAPDGPAARPGRGRPRRTRRRSASGRARPDGRAPPRDGSAPARAR